MQNTIFYFSTCDTCREILKDIHADRYDFDMQDIKTAPVTKEQLEILNKMSGSYEALFSKRAQLYKSLGLVSKNLTESDYKRYLLEHYTFLRRPVIIYMGNIFIGSDKTVVQSLKEALAKK